jgi:hypothetical protein
LYCSTPFSPTPLSPTHSDSKSQALRSSRVQRGEIDLGTLSIRRAVVSEDSAPALKIEAPRVPSYATAVAYRRVVYVRGRVGISVARLGQRMREGSFSFLSARQPCELLRLLSPQVESMTPSTPCASTATSRGLDTCLARADN